MSGIQTLHCAAGHDWTRPTIRGRKPDTCPEHPEHRTYNSEDPETRRTYWRNITHGGSEVTAEEVYHWALSLGLEGMNRKLSGPRGAGVITRWNREHPDRPYVRTTARRVRQRRTGGDYCPECGGSTLMCSC